jgi:hypothetical protein
MKNRSTILLLALSATLFSACKKDKDPPATPAPPPNEEEVITTVILTFTDAEPGVNAVFHLRWTDLDGDGGNAPVITADALPVGRYFNVEITLLNESVNPPEDITEEVREEAAEHQFFFEQGGAAGLLLSNFDLDANGRPLGSIFNAQTVSAGIGTLKVTLRHDPDKAAPGVAEGDITNAGGDTDVEVEFPVIIE